jgi:hypothetical protein
MIGDCLEYYSRVLGARDRVVVVDNGSTHPTVLQAYALHTELGGHVVVDRRSFKDAVSFMSEHMRQWAQTCDWLLPMETDEIVFDLQPQQQHGTPIRVAPEAVGRALAEHLRGVPEDVGILGYGRFLGSMVDPADAGYSRGAYTRPIRQMTRFFDQGWDKIIVRSRAFVGMKLWCHHAETMPGFRKVVSDRLGLLHFHDTGLKRQVERARPVVEAYGYINSSANANADDDHVATALRLRDAPIACGHKVRYLCNHLMRRATLQAFRRTLGRMPVSRDEMEVYALHLGRHPAAGVRNALLAGRVRRDAAILKSQLSFEELLYVESRQAPPDDAHLGNKAEYAYSVDMSAEETATLELSSATKRASGRLPASVIGFV